MAKNKGGELTPAQRSLRASIAAYTLHATHDPKETTAAGRHASNVTRFEKMVDPDNILAPEERARRVELARKAYMRGLALKRSRTATAKKAAAARETEQQPIV